MSSTARLAQLRKVQGQIGGMITSGKCYEAIRLIFTIANRHATAKVFEAAYAITVDGALGLLGQGEASLGAQVGMHYIDILRKADAELTQERVDTIKKIFDAFPSDSVASSSDAAAGPATAAAASVTKEDQAVRFMRHAIKWALTASRDLSFVPFSFKTNTDFGTPAAPASSPAEQASRALEAPRSLAPLYNALAAHLRRTKAFSLASKAYFKAGAPAQHAVMLAEWASSAPSEDTDLFFVRAALQALAAGDVKHAATLVKVFRAQYRLTGEAETPLAHFAEFFTTACAVGSKDLYRLLTVKYALALLRDPSLKPLINQAAGTFCGVQQQKSMLEMMLGGAGGAAARG